MPTKPEMLKEARDRGIGPDELSDDATKDEIQAALDQLPPTPGQAAAEVDDEQEAQYPLKRVIRESAGFLGVPSYVAAGALAKWPDATISKSAATVAVSAFREAKDTTIRQEA